MDKTQKRTLLIISLIGLVYFIAFFFPNASTLSSDNPAVFLHRDEFVTYPIVERMLAFEGDIHSIWGSLIIYGDYHYGYPFYFFSMLVLLPYRLFGGTEFFNRTPFNILMLRQFINVLPMVFTAGVSAYLTTCFKSLWKSILIFIFVLTIPAVVRSNLHWWHPDSLTLLAIALTFLFLDLDEYRLGKFFYFAAATCGIASAIKLMGFFFFLVIPLYLLIAWSKTKTARGKLLKAALIFILVMVVIILVSNPFLFYKAPREDMLAIQTIKSQELSQGYTHEESLYYAKGPQYWRWTFKVSYGKPWTIYFLIASLVFGCFFSQRREMNWLISAWVLPIGTYLMWFVAPKPDHYLLPLMLPLFTGILNLEYPFEAFYAGKKSWMKWLALMGMLLFSILIVIQLDYQAARSLPQYLAYFGY